MPPSRVLLTVLAIAGGGISYASAAELKNVIQFNNTDGAVPSDGLILVNGQLFGTTTFGGTPSSGTIFQLDPATGAETVLYSFQGGTDGAEPDAALVYHDNKLFGTTTEGGIPNKCQNRVGCGTVFSFDTTTGQKTVLYRFTGRKDGGTPAHGSLIYLNGTLYGATFAGGAAQMGVVYAVDPASGTETVLHTFTGGGDGVSPDSGLLYANGLLYGTTPYGGGSTNCGNNGCGVVFAVDPATGTETILHAFENTGDGAVPGGSLAYHHGTLYGGVGYGATPSSVGGIFSIDTSNGAEKVLFTFNGTDGASGGSLLYHNGHLYGVTPAGGPGFGNQDTYGTVFDFDLTTSRETVLHAFTDGGDGAFPAGRPVYMNGHLFGVTSEAGALCGCGTVFSIKH
jgi:uncharacterized repeat protein (TIGR03803 family)